MKRLTLLLLAAVVIGAVVALRAPAATDWLDRFRDTPATFEPSQTGQRDGVRGLVVLPDDGPGAILGEIADARQSIDLYVYLLPADDVISELAAAHERGVDVRVILERDPFGGGNSNQDAYDRLSAVGIDVRWAPQEFQLSHIKTLVIDREAAMIMTLNLSWSALTRNREFAVVSTAPADVDAVADLFEADWSGRSWRPAGDIVTSPDNSRTVVRELIEGATRTIEIYAEVVRDNEVREHLIEAAEAGVAVRLLVPTNPAADDLLIYRELEEYGVQVKLLADAYSHAKAIIVDRERALVGSQNLTLTSLDRNRECGILLEDEATLARLTATFQSDWDASAPPD